MLLVSLYILSVPLQEVSELPVVLVLHDHIFPYLSISYKQNSVLLSISLYLLLKCLTIPVIKFAHYQNIDN
jgi:hypothetical protein